MQSIDNLSPEEKRALLAQLLSATANKPKVAVLSFAQQRLWFLEQLAPGSASYNLLAAQRLKGRLDLRALSQAFHMIVQRHEILRTTFQVVAGNPLQFIAPTVRLALPILDLGQLPPARIEMEIRRLANQEARRRFDLARGPLLYPTLLRIDELEQILLVSMHHIIIDGWSLGIFLRELTELYNAYAGGKPASLPELPIQYADYALWQREWLQGDRLHAQLAYWRQQLAGAPQLLELPTDHPRPPIPTFRGAAEMLALPQPLAEQLKALSRSTGATLFMMLLAGWQIVLYRYSRQEDILVGSPIAGRNRRELEGLIGCFVNTLTLRTDLSGNPSFYELAKRVREVCLGAYAHQDLPFERLVEELHPQRVLSHHPLFQVTFSLQAETIQPLELAGLQQVPLHAENGTAKFDLELIVEEQAQGLVATIGYSTDLFNAATIARLLEHYRTLLEGIVSGPGQRIAQLPLLTAAERQQVLDGWNTTTVDIPEVCVHELFARQAACTPDAVAVVFDPTTGHQPPTTGADLAFRPQPSAFSLQMTYAEFDRRANQLAHELRAHGVAPNDLVAVCVERSLELLVGILGILKAGGAYVPLDPAHPAERLAFMLRDSGAQVLVTSDALSVKVTRRQDDKQNGGIDDVTLSPGHLVTRSHGSVIDLVTDWPAIARQATTNPDVPVTPGNLAYVIYTSGSTGTPKGVQIPHASLLNLVFWHRRAFEITAADRASQIASPTFDASVWELWPYLVAGASVHLPAAETRVAVSQLQSWLLNQAITISFVPTPLAERLLVLQWPAKTSLRLLLTGGDRLRGFPSPALPFTLVNNYGPTENTVVTTSGVVPPAARITPAIGRPIANTQLYLLDDTLQPVPIGVPGELFIGGAGLAWGYLGRPDLTAERFVPNPFGEISGIGYRVLGVEPSDTRYPIPDTRLYKTGDLARWLPDGAIEFVGRVDQQVKLRGFRVELGEIEAVLGSHPALRECAVLAREEAAGERAIIAYYVSAQTPAPNVNELRSHLQQRLPGYMIPTSFMLLDALPLSPNGKLDRRALPAPDTARPDLAAGFVAPRDDMERAIAAIWQDVLKLDQVGVHDNFFDLGGHSLLVLQVLGRLHEQLRPDVSVIEVFQYPTISLLAEHLTHGQADQAPLKDAQFRADTRRGLIGQQRQLRRGIEQS